MCLQHVWVEDQSYGAARKSNRTEKLIKALRLGPQAPCVKDLPQANRILIATCLQTPEVKPSTLPPALHPGGAAHAGIL